MISSQTVPLTTRTHNGYPLTDEQNHATDLAETGQDLKIEAYAGAGKTSTLSAISSALSSKKGIYIAFNKAIADEAAEKFPDNVTCRTAHSLAFGAVGYKYKDRIGSRIPGSVLARKYLKLFEPVFCISPAAMGNLVIDTINHFTLSSAGEIDLSHVPRGELKAIEAEKTRNDIADQTLIYARDIWEKMRDINSAIPVTHDVYLKLWAMTRPTINKDFILFDEAQDASPSMLGLVCHQDAQKIFVGDRHQQIYSFRGAINAMQTIETVHTCQISQSFRFGQPIADIANQILNSHLKAGVAIRGFDGISSSIGSDPAPVAILCRTNARLINTLIERLEAGDRVAIAGGCLQLISLIRGAEELIEKGTTSYRELMLFKSWDEVVYFSESESGSDLAPVVKMINKFGPERLLKILEKTHQVKEKDADLILSTAHKSKGREWTRVRLENDFRDPDKDGYTEEDSNLLYVAATRAMNNLDIDVCDTVQKLL